MYRKPWETECDKYVNKLKIYCSSDFFIWQIENFKKKYFFKLLYIMYMNERFIATIPQRTGMGDRITVLEASYTLEEWYSTILSRLRKVGTIL